MRSPFVKLFLSMKELKTPLPFNPGLALIGDKLGCSQSLFCQVISVCSHVTTLNVINFRMLLDYFIGKIERLWTVLTGPDIYKDV